MQVLVAHGRALVRRIKCAQGFNLVLEDLDAHGFYGGEGKNVQDVPAQAHFTWSLGQGLAFVLMLDQVFEKPLPIDGVAAAQGDQFLFQILEGWQRLQQGNDAAHNQAWLLLRRAGHALGKVDASHGGSPFCPLAGGERCGVDAKGFQVLKKARGFAVGGQDHQAGGVP